MFPPSQTSLTPFVVPLCDFQNRKIFSWLINFDQQKFYTTYKYKKDIYFIETTRDAGIVQNTQRFWKGHSPYFLLWWAGEAVVTIGMLWFRLYVWA